MSASRLRRLVDRVKGNYTAVAVALHASARLQLREAGRASTAALAAAERKRVGRQVPVFLAVQCGVTAKRSFSNDCDEGVGRGGGGVSSLDLPIFLTVRKSPSLTS